MLTAIGVKSLDELYADVPAELRLKAEYDLPKGATEPELKRRLKEIGAQNIDMVCFAGGGFYKHYTPEVVADITSRSEFLTAYTPYQPEISQGTLGYIFEYQSMMSELTGMDVSNASMYDGATATAEAMIMAVASARKRRRILVSETVTPTIQQVLATYAHGEDITLEMIPQEGGHTSIAALEEALNAGDVAGVIVAQPNAYGIIEDFSGVADKIHDAKALFIMNCHALTLGVLRSPGEWGADIACGEAQSLGMPLNYGGPYLGYLCCKKALIRKLPGRIVGATTDGEGKRCFVLTLQAREQHIRRQKATSNICSNQGIMTLHAAAYLSLMGADGIRKVNEVSARNAHLLAQGLCQTGKMSLLYPDEPFLNEFAVQLTDGLTSTEVLFALANENILGGIALTDDTILICATEENTDDEISEYIQIVEEL